MAFMFENLKVYDRSLDFADRVITITKDAPRGFRFLTDQLNRAALSVPLNLAEGNGRFTKADRRNFFTIARGSVQECVPLLELARRHELIADDEHLAIRTELEEIARMISGLINGLEKQRV
ncbi:MAG: four helix bundle protein [Planctomycetes bacterium]|nr:four helix bundle protein [Planctomycetota bacterium]NOG52751.1 four helix bundle protein [Planctomycetota bacterium]